MDGGLHVPRSLIAQQEIVTLPLVAIEKIEAELCVKGLHSPVVGGMGAEAWVSVVLCSQNGNWKQRQDVGLIPLLRSGGV